MVIIKADHLFVYNKSKLYAPRYAVSLGGLDAKLDGSVVSLVNQGQEEEVREGKRVQKWGGGGGGEF